MLVSLCDNKLHCDWDEAQRCIQGKLITEYFLPEQVSPYLIYLINSKEVTSKRKERKISLTKIIKALS